MFYKIDQQLVQMHNAMWNHGEFCNDKKLQLYISFSQVILVGIRGIPHDLFADLGLYI